mgnify:CR=1 FL=1
MANEKDSMKFIEFDESLRKFALCSSLIELAKASQSLEQNQVVVSEFSIKKGIETFKTIVTQWALAFISYRLVIKSNDFRGHPITSQDIALLNNWYTNLYEPFIDKNDKFLGVLGRMSQEQFWWQGIGMYDFSRAYYLISEVSQKVEYGKKLDLNKVFYENF